VHDICCQSSLILLIAWPTNKNVSSYHLATVSKIHVVVTVYCVNYFRQLTYRVKESVHLNRPTVEPNRIRKNNGRRVSINDESCGQPTGNKWAMRRNSTHVLQLGELHPPSLLLWIFLLYCCCLSCHKFDVWQIFLCQVHFRATTVILIIDADATSYMFDTKFTWHIISTTILMTVFHVNVG